MFKGIQLSLNCTQNFTRINEILSRESGVALHRQVFILAGDETWQKCILQETLSGYEAESLWLTDQVLDDFPSLAIKKARGWLGNETKVVVFDANQDFDPDSFAAISGIVVGGGLFFLLMPAVERWNVVYASPFGQRLLKSINRTAELILINETDATFVSLPGSPEATSAKDFVAPFLTTEQQSVVESIEVEILNDTSNPVVVISDRGRGKSAALGLVVARLLESGIKKIAITAPRLRATNIVFKHIAENLPTAIVTRGCVKFGDSIVQFYAPDELMKGNVDMNVLLIDEAAAIPVPLLSGYLEDYPQCVFATTVHGYEGTGRGFALRFNQILNEKYPGWLKLQMQTPIRWAANDPLENWMFSLLCLDADPVDVSYIVEIEPDKIEHYLLDKTRLKDDQDLLNEIFALLVLAHYRTRPQDLKSLLDDADIALYVTQYNKHVIAVALVIREGRFSEILSTDVYRGERRPSGHLLAQALTYHCGIEHAATLNYARVMRIAVHPELQQQGIGSSLLDFIVTTEKRYGRDAIGTSFGMNTPLLKFWRKLKFNVVRIGFTREQTSGEHAAIMLLPLTERGSDIYNEACTRFRNQVPFWFEDLLKEISEEIKTSFDVKPAKISELNQYDKKDLESFTQYSRNYELCIAALTKIVMLEQDVIKQETFPENFRRILIDKVVHKLDWKEIGLNIGLNGKNEARNIFHSAVSYLLNK